ncbi:hypothetical protein [Halopseudomonas salegens]|uniref:Uncharacterized protein n=1 Tax=Halopseudomonas salegens TaxID=1434072 RepID=A0A1H2E8N1_9GAMM|nr:hypothetical protein [Halopseudomonas salegens]SDT91394.1 hypothetical protein SAMN05216210_0449 [Halopseudomonas salegens]
MSVLVIVLGILVLLLGLAVLVLPERVFALLDDNAGTQSLFYASVIGRVFLGLVLLLAAFESAFPGVLQVLGVIAVVLGTVTALMGREKVAKVAHRVDGLPVWVKRTIGAFWVFIGVLLIWLGWS